ncbi:MAG: oligosaccharide flippase family protein [Bacteroidales bacterium]
MVISIIEKIRKNKLFQNGLLFTFFSIFNNGINFFLVILLAYYVNFNDYGDLNLFNTFVSLLGVLLSLNTIGILSVEYFNISRLEIQKLIVAIILISLAVFIVLNLLSFVFSDFLFKVTGLCYKYQWMALSVCLCQVFSMINLELLRLEERPIKYGTYTIVVAMLNLVVTLVLIIVFNLGWIGRVYSQIIIGGLFCIISIIWLLHRKYIVMRIPNANVFKNALRFGLPLIPHNAALWIRQGLDRYVINFFWGTEAVALYSYAYNYTIILTIIGLSFNASYSVYVYKYLANADETTPSILLSQIKKLFYFFIFLTVVVYVGLMIAIPILIPKYIDSRSYVLPLCLSGFFQCTYYLFVNILFYFKKTKSIMYITFSVSILHFLLSSWLVRFNPGIAAYISLISNMAIFIIIYLYSQKIYPLPIRKLSLNRLFRTP